MSVSTVARLGFLAVAGVLTACGGDCQAVMHSGGAADTVAIEKTGVDCTVNAYAADSVNPKVPK